MKKFNRAFFISLFLLVAIPVVLLKFTLFDLLTLDLTKAEKDALQFSKNISSVFKLREAVSVLSGAESAILYSLEPDADFLKERNIQKYLKLKDNKWGEAILTGEKAQIAGAEFRKTIGGMVMTCFDCYQPRHALRVFHKGHVYDYELCYFCFRMEVKKDGEFFLILGGNLDRAKPDVLNGLLQDAGVPLPYIYSDDYKIFLEENRIKEVQEKERWIAEMPVSLRALQDRQGFEELYESRHYNKSDLETAHGAISAEYPDATDRFLALLRWYGSREKQFYLYTQDLGGVYFPEYQDLVPKLMLYDQEAISVVILRSDLNDQHLRGLARWYVEAVGADQRQPQQFPLELRKALLEKAEEYYGGLSYSLSQANELFSSSESKSP